MIILKHMSVCSKYARLATMYPACPLRSRGLYHMDPRDSREGKGFPRERKLSDSKPVHSTKREYATLCRRMDNCTSFLLLFCFFPHLLCLPLKKTRGTDQLKFPIYLYGSRLIGMCTLSGALFSDVLPPLRPRLPLHLVLRHRL